MKGAGAHGFDGEVWTSTRVAMVVQRATGVKLGSTGVQRLLRDRLGWRFQPAASDTTGATAPQPLPVEAAATESLATVAEAAVVGKTHELKGQALAAFVTLRDGYKHSTELRDELRNFVG